jgi:hypothetical protein
MAPAPLSVCDTWMPSRRGRNATRKLLGIGAEARMKLLLLAGFLSLSIIGAAVARAEDCNAKFTDDQRKTFASLPPEDQQAVVKMKMKNGASANCDFQAGLLEMLGNFPPEERAKSFHQLLKGTFVKQD